MRTQTAAMCFACVFAMPLAGCAGIVLVGIPIDFVTTEVLPRAVNGKGLVEDAADLVTGKDCRAIEGTVRDDRQICETRNSPATKKDFKGISGLVDHEDKDGSH
jgi:hypothetical protein